MLGVDGGDPIAEMGFNKYKKYFLNNKQDCKSYKDCPHTRSNDGKFTYRIVDCDSLRPIE